MQEHDHKRRISRWLNEHGVHGIYWEQQNDWGYEVFNVKNGSGKPDMLIDTDRHTIVVEFKKGDRLTTTLDAKHQLLRYLDDHVNGGAEYIAMGEVVKPDIFLMATQYAPDAMLNMRETNIPEMRTYDNPYWPYAEPVLTKMITRDLWKQYTHEGFDFDRHPVAGVLVSDRFTQLMQRNLGNRYRAKPAMMHNRNGEFFEIL